MPLPIRSVTWENELQKPDVYCVYGLDRAVVRIQYGRGGNSGKMGSKSLSELKIREQYGINAVGIIQGEKVEVTLDPYAPLPKDAILILIGATAVLEKFHTWK